MNNYRISNLERVLLIMLNNKINIQPLLISLICHKVSYCLQHDMGNIPFPEVWIPCANSRKRDGPVRLGGHLQAMQNCDHESL